MNDKPLQRDAWYTEAFDGYGYSHVVLIDRAIVPASLLAPAKEKK